MGRTDWKVVPICERQLRDINPDHLIDDGLFRVCDTYKNGGGYDKFEEIYRRRNGLERYNRRYNLQFVVQLKGCPFDCPYCYVTRDGVMGEHVDISTEHLVSVFRATNASVFHLMGGAPAIYMDSWEELLCALELNWSCAFHSDFLLQEFNYNIKVLNQLSKYDNCLYAVSIKGSTPEEFERNTGRKLNEDMFWDNLNKLHMCNIPFYLTYTGMSDASVEFFKSQVRREFPRHHEDILRDSFKIDIVQYEALKD